MSNGDEQSRRRRQIDRLLGYAGVGPLNAPAIAMNLGTSQEELQPLLDALVAEGRLVRASDGRYAAPTTERGEAGSGRRAGD